MFVDVVVVGLRVWCWCVCLVCACGPREPIDPDLRVDGSRWFAAVVLCGVSGRLAAACPAGRSPQVKLPSGYTHSVSPGSRPPCRQRWERGGSLDVDKVPSCVGGVWVGVVALCCSLWFFRELSQRGSAPPRRRR